MGKRRETGTVAVKPGANRTAFRRILHTEKATGFYADLKNPGLWNDFVVEMVMCMYLTCTLIWVGVTLLPDLYNVSMTHIGVWAALVCVVLFEGYGPISGASMSAARTFAYFVAGGFTAARAIVYTVAEFAGSAFGGMIAFWLTPSDVKISAIIPGPGMSDGMAMVVEAIVTFNLIFVGLVVGDPFKRSVISSVATGFAIGSGAMAAGTHTGGLQNPSLAFGPCVASGNFSRYWPYLVGPYLGATTAALFWMTVNYIRYNYDPNYIQLSTDDNVTHHESPDDVIDDVGHAEPRDDDVIGQRCVEDAQHADTSAV